MPISFNPQVSITSAEFIRGLKREYRGIRQQDGPQVWSIYHY